MIPCLRAVPDSAPVQSPFSQLVAWGVFDGPTHGLLGRADDGEYVVFRLLAWDESREVRVFGLWQLEQRTAIAVLKALSEREEPMWPEWWVRQPVPLGSPEEAMLAAIEAAINATEFIVVTESLLGRWKGGMHIRDTNRGALSMLGKRSTRTC